MTSAEIHRWERSLKESNRRLPFIVCRPKKTYFRFPFPFAANNRKFEISVFHLQQTNGSRLFQSVPFPLAFHNKWHLKKIVSKFRTFSKAVSSVVEPLPQEAETFGWSRYSEVKLRVRLK
jgi:hypothetical protein